MKLDPRQVLSSLVFGLHNSGMFLSKVLTKHTLCWTLMMCLRASPDGRQATLGPGLGLGAREERTGQRRSR